MNCIHGVRLDKDCIFCINGTEPTVSLPIKPIAVSSETETLAKKVAELPTAIKDDKSIDVWARDLANDISKGKD